jgi:outer membrane protein insertion porin family
MSALYRLSFVALNIVLCLWLGFLTGCSPTRHVPQGQYLLRNNNLKLKSDRTLTNKGELSDALSSLIIQKPNYYFLSLFPYKVWVYNWRYKRYTKDTAAEAFQRKIKTVERPVVYDSILSDRSAQHMRSYLFNQGYFYSSVKDTVRFKGRKAFSTYEVETGLRYLINKTVLDIDDSTIRQIVAESMVLSPLQEGKPFAMTLAEEERSRIATVLRNNGYYKFSQENIHVIVDTFNKAFLKDAANPFESAINFLALQRADRKPTIDVSIIIRKGEEPNAYRRYKIGKVRVYPDFIDRKDITDSTMYERVINNTTFRYHDYYIRERVLLNHIFLKPGEYFTQDNYDLTITKLNELGLFQYVQTYIIEDTTLPEDRSLRCVILMNPTKRYDFSVNLEVTNGNTYDLGNNVGLNFRNRNLLKGANQLSISLNGGVEFLYDKTLGDRYIDHFFLRSRNYGINGNLDFPKFIGPASAARLIGAKTPRTRIGIGTNVLERINYFTLINTSLNLTYNWRQNISNTWDFSPAFINVLRLPYISDTFQALLNSNAYLRNSYQENFIEGENISFTYTNQNSPIARRHYSYLRLGFEEAGGLLKAVNGFGLNYSQYLKVETDARHYIRRKHAELATRFFAGVGIPYDKSSVLPYIKQYFVGGPYSLRGWRVRQLGPGSYRDTASTSSSSFIDRTGDIKLEANAELRFDLFQLFGGALRLNGAAFIDAGNIWLTQPADNYPGGDFQLSRLGSDIAVSGGLGLRVDFSGLFVLRIDEGFPLKNPDYAQYGGWVTDEIHVLNKDWQERNLVLHIAIGYPF